MKTNAQFNLNSSVTVHLTEHGVNILRQRHYDLEMKIRSSSTDIQQFVPPENDMYTAQMWYLIQVFGEHIGMAMKQPFDLSITLHDVDAQVHEVVSK